MALLWVVVAFGSGAGAVLVYFIVIEITLSIWLLIIIIAPLAALCLYSIFVLISSGRRREGKITDIISPIDDETNNSIEENTKKIEQND